VIDVPPDLRIPERQLGRLRLDAASSGASVVFVTERSPHGASLGTFVCLHLGVQHTRGAQLRVEVTKSKLGNMGHRSAVAFEDLHSVRVESTL